jgi:hypothetical protein
VSEASVGKPWVAKSRMGPHIIPASFDIIPNEKRNTFSHDYQTIKAITGFETKSVLLEYVIF